MKESKEIEYEKIMNEKKEEILLGTISAISPDAITESFNVDKAIIKCLSAGLNLFY